MLLAATALSAQVAKPRKGTFALTNATIETITNGAQKGTLLIQNRDGSFRDDSCRRRDV